MPDTIQLCDLTRNSNWTQTCSGQFLVKKNGVSDIPCQNIDSKSSWKEKFTLKVKGEKSYVMEPV